MRDATSIADAWLKTFAREVFAQKEPEGQLPAHMVPTDDCLKIFLWEVMHGRHPNVPYMRMHTALTEAVHGAFWFLDAIPQSPDCPSPTEADAADRAGLKAKAADKTGMADTCCVVQSSGDFLSLHDLHKALVDKGFPSHKNPVFLLVEMWMLYGVKQTGMDTRSTLFASTEPFAFAQDGSVSVAHYTPVEPADRDVISDSVYIPGYGPESDGEAPLGHILLPSDPESPDGRFLPLLQKGRSARLDKRLLVNLLACVPRDAKTAGGHFVIKLTLRDLTLMLWPEGVTTNSDGTPSRSNWRPANNEKQLRTALLAMSWCGIILPVDKSKGWHGGTWFPVALRQMPNFNNPDSPAVFDMGVDYRKGRNDTLSDFSPHFAPDVLADQQYVLPTER